MSYDLRGLRPHGLIQRIPRKNTYILTRQTEIRPLRTLEHAVADYIQTARLAPAK